MLMQSSFALWSGLLPSAEFLAYLRPCPLISARSPSHNWPSPSHSSTAAEAPSCLHSLAGRDLPCVTPKIIPAHPLWLSACHGLGFELSLTTSPSYKHELPPFLPSVNILMIGLILLSPSSVHISLGQWKVCVWEVCLRGGAERG